MGNLEYKEFRPFYHSRFVVEGEGTPAWIKKISKRRKNELHDRFGRALHYAMEDYLRTVADNIPVKKKVKGEITAKDLLTLLAQMRRDLKHMKAWVFGCKPMAFTRSNPYYRKGDEKAPFYSEAFLYALLGKDAGRTVCYSFDRICKLVGLGE